MVPDGSQAARAGGAWMGQWEWAIALPGGLGGMRLPMVRQDPGGRVAGRVGDRP